MDVISEFRDLLFRKNIAFDVLSMFEALPDTPKRVRFIQSLLEENHLVPTVELRQTKNDAVSKFYRELGNNVYRKQRFLSALQAYNQAICFADAEGLSLGYANRSATYLELKMYDECLDNCRLAREAGYPTKLLPKLADRETKCREAIRKRTANTKPLYQPKLSYPAMKGNPSVANCIELVVNEKYGRHYIAKHDLKAGDIVILERPYQVILSNDCNYRKCANCLSENKFNLIPCLGCTKTMFCSQLCLESAAKFHQTLCPIIAHIFEWPESHIFFALRILLSLIQELGSVEALAAARTSGAAKTGDKKICRQNALDAFHAMEPRFEALQFIEAIQFASIFSVLMKNTDLSVKLAKGKSHELFLDLWHRYSNLSVVNSIPTEIMERTAPHGEIFPISYASGIFTKIGLLNHSCAANTILIPCNGSLTAAIIRRPVKKGDQLFVSYGPHHIKEFKKDRQLDLFTRHKFICDCEACTKDYPTFISLPQMKTPTKVLLSVHDRFQMMDQKKALRMFKDCKEYLHNNESNYPSIGLQNARIGIMYAFSALCHNYGLSACLK